MSHFVISYLHLLSFPAIYTYVGKNEHHLSLQLGELVQLKEEYGGMNNVLIFFFWCSCKIVAQHQILDGWNFCLLELYGISTMSAVQERSWKCLKCMNFCRMEAYFRLLEWNAWHADPANRSRSRQKKTLEFVEWTTLKYSFLMIDEEQFFHYSKQVSLNMPLTYLHNNKFSFNFC